MFIMTTGKTTKTTTTKTVAAVSLFCHGRN